METGGKPLESRDESFFKIGIYVTPQWAFIVITSADAIVLFILMGFLVSFKFDFRFITYYYYLLK